jgi:hypothetical protein
MCPDPSAVADPLAVATYERKRIVGTTEYNMWLCSSLSGRCPREEGLCVGLGVSGSC